MIINARQFSLSLIAIFLSVGIIGYLASQPQLSYHAESDSYINIWITPAIATAVDTAYELQWTSARITGVYLNEQGKIGEYLEVFDNTCQIHEFMVNFENGDQKTFRVRPFKVLHPLVISLIVISLTVICVWAVPFNIPFLKTIGNYFSPLYDWTSEHFWHRWIVLILFNISLFTGFLYLVDTCQSQAILSIGQHFRLLHGILIATGIVSFMMLVLVVLRSSSILALTQIIRLIPYPIVITGIFAYWCVCFYLLLTFSTLIDEFMVAPLALFIFVIWAIVIHIRLQPNESQSELIFKKYITPKTKPIITIVISIIWILAYRTDWVVLIHNDALQIGIGAVLYMLPGLLLVLIIRPTIASWTSLLTLGFVFSFVLSVILWLIVLLLGSTADLLQWLYTLVGLAMWLHVSRQEFPFRLFQLESAWNIFHTLLLCLGILSIFVVSSLIVEPGFGHIDGDGRAYNPLVTDYAQTQNLNLLDPYLGNSANMQYRMWLAVWTVPQSLIITFSQLHILTSFHLIAFYLTIFVFIVTYDVTRRFGLPESFSLIAISIFAYLIMTHLGVNQFGLRLLKMLLHDKLMASFILSPLAILATFEYLQQQSKTRLFVTIVSIMAVMLGHPTVYFNTCLVIAMMTCLYVVIKSHQWKHIILIALICGVWMMVPFSIRIASESVGITYMTGDVEELLERTDRNERSNISEEGEFLGIDPQLINDTTYILLAIAVIFSLIHLRQSHGLFLVVPMVVLLLIVLNPVTSVILGRFISHTQLWRTPWLIPYGVIGAMVLWMFYLTIHKLHPSSYLVFHIGMIILASLTFIESLNIALSPPYADTSREYAQAGNLQQKLIEKREEASTPVFQFFEDVVEIGSYIRSFSQGRIYFLADNRLELNYLIPAISTDFHGITWYSLSFPNITRDEFRARNKAYNALFNDSLSVDTFIEIMEHYQIDYIVLSKEYKHLETIMAQSGIVEEDMKPFGSLRLWKIK